MATTYTISDLAREFDLDVNDCDKLPAPDVAQRAKRFAIADYLTLFEPSEPYQTKVEQVKTALANKKAWTVADRSPRDH